MRWFGPHWGAPVCQYADQVASPIGEMCEMCAEHFTSTQEGLMLSFSDDHGETWRDYPVHLDCLLGSVIPGYEPAA